MKRMTTKLNKFGDLIKVTQLQKVGQIIQFWVSSFKYSPFALTANCFTIRTGKTVGITQYLFENPK